MHQMYEPVIAPIRLGWPELRGEEQPRVKDAIVVLGSSTNPSSPVMRARVARAVDLWRQGVAPYLVMCGRCSFRLENAPERTEAAVMGAYATSLGVPADRVILEDESGDTLGNAYFSKVRFLEPREWLDVMLVTSETHARRARWLFEKVLGAHYRLDVATIDTAANTAEREREVLSSEQLLRDTQARLADVADGDHESIRPLVPLPPRAQEPVSVAGAAR